MHNSVHCDNTVPAMMGPEIISSTKEIDGKLPDIVRQVSNVEWNYFRTTDLSGPPSKTVYIRSNRITATA